MCGPGDDNFGYPLMKLSIHILASGHLEALQECCRSVADALPAESDVLVALNGAHEETLQWLKVFKHPAFRWVCVEATSPGSVRNSTMRQCEGEILYFLDEKVTVPQHLFYEVIGEFDDRPNLALVGGPSLVRPESGHQERLLGSILASWFTAPITRRRYGAALNSTEPASQNDFTEWNFAIKRRVISSSLSFEDSMHGNQESLFVYDSMKLGLELLFSPALYVFHDNGNLRSFAKKCFRDGVDRGRQTYLRPESLHWIHLVPAITWILLLGAFLSPFRLVLLPTLLIAHVVLSLAGILSSTQLRNLGMFALLGIPLTALVHLGYGLGFWQGFMGSLFWLPNTNNQTLRSSEP
jgi:hypothetical protein